MDVKLDPNSMQTVVAKAILDTISPEDRAELITGALKFLITPVEHRSSYAPNRTASPLQDIFQEAAQNVARMLVKDQLENDEVFNAKLKELFTQLGDRLFASEARDKILEKMVSQVVANINGRDY